MKLNRYAASFAVAVLTLLGCDSSSVGKLLDEASEAPGPPVASIPANPNASTASIPSQNQRPAGFPAPIPGTAPPVQGGRPHVRVGSFNIQTFGQSKLGKPAVMKRIARIVREFDVLAIQEIRSKEQNVMPSLTQLVNQMGQASDGRHYAFLIGPRLGRTSSKEQYAFIYDTARVAPDERFVWTLTDTYEDFHREPYIARFKFVAEPPSGRQPWTFTLINIHTDPDEADSWEINRLDDVFRAVQRDGSGEDDYIIVGDLNVSDTNLGELGQMRHVIPALRNVTTNTRRTAMYDNIVFDRTKTSEYTGMSGVFDFAAEWGLTEREALEISDHLPIWADFYAGENTGAILAGDQPVLQ